MEEKKAPILSSPFSSTHLNRRGGPCLCYPFFTFQYFVGERQINMQKVSAAGLASRIWIKHEVLVDLVKLGLSCRTFNLHVGLGYLSFTGVWIYFLAWPHIRGYFVLAYHSTGLLGGVENKMHCNADICVFICHEVWFWDLYKHVYALISTVFMFVQGDLRDILHLRKGLLRTILGHINWKVCLLYILMNMKYFLVFYLFSLSFYCSWFYQSMDVDIDAKIYCATVECEVKDWNFNYFSLVYHLETILLT